MSRSFDSLLDSAERTVRSNQLTASHRILLVDDNEDAAELLSLLLTQLGHTVRDCQ